MRNADLLPLPGRQSPDWELVGGRTFCFWLYWSEMELVKWERGEAEAGSWFK
jgi:hypothetical protein